MDSKMLIEIFGYIGSFLVLVSFLMVSVVKLRIVNTIGSLIFMIYALIIKSYPTAIMNFCLVLINLHFLYRMNKKDNKEYDLISVKKNDSLTKYLIDKYKDDIKECFPDTNFSFTKANKGYVVFCQGMPVGITLGKEKDGEMELLLDYTIPEYRDFSIGSYLIPKLGEEGIKKLIFSGSDEHHKEYLKKMGFEKQDKKYIKTL